MSRAQRRVVIFAATTIGLIAASHVVVEAAGLRFFQPQADESMRTLDAFETTRPRVDVVLMGSSRVRRAFVPSVIEESLQGTLGDEVSVFNLSFQGATTPTYYILARDLLAGPTQPRLVLLGLGPRSLNSNSPRYWRVVRHLASPADLVGPLGPRWTNGEELGSAVMALFRAPATLMQTWRIATRAYETSLAEVLALGGGVYEPSAVRVELPADDAALSLVVDAAKLTAGLAKRQARMHKRARYTREVLLADFSMEGQATRGLELLFELCRERGIDLVVLSMPVTPAFAAEAYQHGERAAFLAHVRALCNAHDVPFVEPDPPHPYLFRDGDHLTRMGADAFSRLVAREILLPRLSAPDMP